jgi:penicillin-binding protein activator
MHNERNRETRKPDLRPHRTLLALAVCAALSVGCASSPPPPPAAVAVTYKDVGSTGMVAGVGVESQDIVAVSDAMVRDLLASGVLGQFQRPPRILFEADNFETDGVQRINKSLIVDRLRGNLQRSSKGRLHFVRRSAAADVQKERDLKRTGVTDKGTVGLSAAQGGVDFLIKGSLITQDKRSASTGMVERYTQLNFDLIDAENSISVWTNMYEMQKGGRDDAIYR